MKLTAEQFNKLFGKLAGHQQVVGYGKESNDKWNEGYSCAFNRVYDALVVNGVEIEDEDEFFFPRNQRVHN